MYKRKENPVYLDQKNLQTRAYQAPKFIVPNFNIIQFKNSILYKGSSMWNELHNETKNIPTYLAFKEKTKILSKQWDLFLSFMKYLLVAKDFETIALSKPWSHTHHIWNHRYSIIHSIYISSHIIPHHYICCDKTGNKCNAGLTGRPVLYTEPINWPRVNFRNKKIKKRRKKRSNHVHHLTPQWHCTQILKPIFNYVFFGCVGTGNTIFFCVGSILNINNKNQIKTIIFITIKHDPKSTEFWLKIHIEYR